MTPEHARAILSLISILMLWIMLWWLIPDLWRDWQNRDDGGDQ